MYSIQVNANIGGGSKVSPNEKQLQHQQQQNPIKKIAKQAYVKIVEQPASKALRFRYECEGLSAGSIPGVNSTPEMKTFPTIEIVGYKGPAVAVVSCVTIDAPYHPHPNNLVGREGCKKGVCTLLIKSDTMRAVFSNLGIQCVKKNDIKDSLQVRKEIRVDPFKTGFSHNSTCIDLNSVRLCFQVFLKGDTGRFAVPLSPVVSEPIYDKRTKSDLVIMRVCSCSASVLGNAKIILQCERVAREDIALRLFEEKDGVTIWEAFGEFEPNDVHKQTAITFTSPKYHNTEITEPVKVLLQLQRPSDGAVSEPVKFEYVPAVSEPEEMRRKFPRTDASSMYSSLQQLQKSIQSNQPDRLTNWNNIISPAICTEPRETSPQQFNLHHGITEMTPSPQALLPPNNYNQIANTPSPYKMFADGNSPLLSPCHQNAEATGGSGVPPNTNAMLIQPEIDNESAFRIDQPQVQHSQYVRETGLSLQQNTHQQSQYQHNQIQQQ